MLATEKTPGAPLSLAPAWPVVTLGVGLAWSTLVSFGGGLSTDAGDYSVENWQLEQGLPQISVTSIAQTPDGYLWLGTFNGLVRFDGVRFTVFDEGNTPNLGNSGIRQLEVDGQGGLWILTMADTVVRMAAGEFTPLPREDALPAPTGSCFLLQDPTHRVLLLDGRGDLLRIEDGHLRPVDRQDPLQAGVEPCLLTSSVGGAAFGVTRGKITRSVPVLVASITDAGSKTNLIDVADAANGRSWLKSHRIRRSSGCSTTGRILAQRLPSKFLRIRAFPKNPATCSGDWHFRLERLKGPPAWHGFGGFTDANGT